jgi:hypothetical protein
MVSILLKTRTFYKKFLNLFKGINIPEKKTALHQKRYCHSYDWYRGQWPQQSSWVFRLTEGAESVIFFMFVTINNNNNNNNMV